MKTNKLANFFALLALVLATAAIGIALTFLNTPATVLFVPEAAVETADHMMAAVCAGDYEAAADYLYGTPDLGVDRAPADETGAMIWEAFLESTDYKLEGECYPTDDGLAQDVLFLSMDLASVTENLGQRAQSLLEARVKDAEDVSQIYDENNEYQQSIVQEVLRQATQQALREDARYIEQKLTLKLTYNEGQWWVTPDQPLISAISGGIAG